MIIVIETTRLILRQFTPDDGNLIYELNRNPDVTAYTGDPVRDIKHGQEVLENNILPQYALYNHGRWAVHKKDDLAFIGWSGLKTRPERDNEIDLGYRYKKESWGNGYATEAAFACLQYGFEKLNLYRIVGRAMPGNLASIRVLEKIGMKYLCEEIVDDHPARTYEAINPLISEKYL